VFILKFNNKNFNNIDRDVNNFIEQHGQKDAVNIVPLPYADFYKYLFSDNVDDVESLQNEFFSVRTGIISNQQKYNDGMDVNVNFNVGRTINVRLDDGSICPIGYTIHFPVNPCKIEAIKVNVYGGWKKDARLKWAYKPSVLEGVDAYLARQNIMIINLNLPDLLDNEIHQSKMTENYMNKLQYCIQSFLHVINTHPESIHPSLNNIKNVPKYLYGASFGGLTALMQAQKYPNSWDGYISHNGWLSSGENEKWDILGRLYNLKIDPSNFNDVLLVLGNAYDNNVNMRDWTNFYEKIKKMGKERLVKTWFTYNGIECNTKELLNTGHGAPNHFEELLTYSSVIRDFMKKDKIVHNVALSKWINLVGLIKSYENDISATPEQLFLAEMHHQEHEKKRVLSEEELKNIFCVFYAIKNEPAYLMSLIKSEPITDDQLAKGFARDYKNWIHFSKKMHNEHPNENPIMEEFVESDPSEIAPELLGSYKKLLLKFSSYYRSYDLTIKRSYLAFLRSMRSFFVENSELINMYELDQDVMKSFEKAKKTWKNFKEDEAEAFKDVMPLFVGQDKDYGDLNFLNDLLELDDGLLEKELERHGVNDIMSDDMFIS
ncbi:MAG: hypothetical protein Q8S31_05120, partial [Alphaproteobacteria bacterium]|nr:hypothetical protein [Alphaproteobacteria bacterium]